MVNWKGCERKQSCPDLMYCSSICQNALQERITGLMADILTGGFLTAW